MDDYERLSDLKKKVEDLISSVKDIENLLYQTRERADVNYAELKHRIERLEINLVNDDSGLNW